MGKEVYEIEQIKIKLYPVFISHGIKKAVLFGSYGKGTPTSESDIDLLVDSNLKGLKFVGLIEEIRRVMDKDVDLFDVSHVEVGSKIDSEIKETGILIYEE